MIIKKFQAKTEEEAIALARKEMGDNVVVMSSRNTKAKGFLSLFSKPKVEITVGMEEETENQIAAAFSALAKSSVSGNLNPSVKSGSIYSGQTPASAVSKDIIPEENTGADAGAKASAHGIEKKLDNLQTLLEQNLTRDAEEENFYDGGDDATVKFLKLIYNTLIENEVDEKYANEIMDEIGKISSPKVSVDILLANIYQKMILMFGQPVTIPIVQGSQQIIFFIGPTGVGKTTTIAKIASQLCVNKKKKVALITTDTFRIAAAEQLRTYASILDVPFKVIYTEDEMMNAVNELKDYDYIMVDTAGHSHHNEEQKDAMKHFLNCVDDNCDKEVYLVLSATTKYKDLLSISDAYSEITDYKLIFTKLDETTTFGNLFNLCMHTGASMSYVTCGQNVPDDIEVFSPQSTVKQLLGGK